MTENVQYQEDELEKLKHLHNERHKTQVEASFPLANKGRHRRLENDEPVERAEREPHTYLGSSMSIACWNSIQWLCSSIKRFLRPKVVSGYRRLEWTCVKLL